MSIPIKQESKYNVVAGKIFNRATAEPIPDDEPIIIFRAKDIHLPQLLKFYKEMVKDEHHQNVIERKFRDVLEWQDKNAHKLKEPDSDESCLT